MSWRFIDAEDAYVDLSAGAYDRKTEGAKKKDKKDKKQHKKDEKEPDRLQIDIGLDAALPGLALAQVTEKEGQEGQERQAAQERRGCERPANSPWSLFAQNAPWRWKAICRCHCCCYC